MRISDWSSDVCSSDLKTAPDALATAMAIGKKIGKVAVVAGVCDGFIGNRMLKPRQMEAMKLLLEGATPAQVDKVHVEFGMPLGAFQMKMGRASCRERLWPYV